GVPRRVPACVEVRVEAPDDTPLDEEALFEPVARAVPFTLVLALVVLRWCVIDFVFGRDAFFVDRACVVVAPVESIVAPVVLVVPVTPCPEVSALLDPGVGLG